MPQTADMLSHMGDDELVAMAQSGSDIAMDHLLDRYGRLVDSWIRGYFLPGADREDLVQEGMVGLFKAVRDHRTGMVFRSFARMCVKRQIGTAVKAYTRQKHLLMNGAESLELFEEEGVPPADLIVDHRDPGDSMMVSSILGMMWAILSPLEAATAACFIDGGTYIEVAAMLGVSPKCVDNARQRVRDKLGPALAGMEMV